MQKDKLPSSEKTISSVERALSIIGLFNNQIAELGITEMARLTRLHKSTLAGLVYTLERNGYLVQNPETRKYRLGLILAERGGVALHQFGVNRVAEPHLKALAERRDEAVNLGMIEESQVVYLDHIASTRSLGITTKIGKRAYIHSTALGKAILITYPLEALEALLSRLDLIAITPHTFTAQETLMAELARSRSEGFALDNEENELGGRCVGVPIFDWSGRAVAAVSLSAPIQRFPPELIPAYSADVMATASAISRDLGFKGNTARLG